MKHILYHLLVMQHFADHIGVVLVPLIQTDGAPVTIVEHLQPTVTNVVTAR